jgi:D-amino-acid oxidase
MKIVVVGAGVSGLTCAVTLLEAGAEVVVWTAGAPSGTVSAVAGAMLGPVFGFGDERSLAWERRSDRVFRRLAGDPATGVRLVTGRLLAAPELGPGLPPQVADVPGFRELLSGARLPAGFTSGFAAELPFADMPRYLGWLTGRVQALGGRIEQRVVTGLSEAGGTADVVVNCSGLGARQLAGDDAVEPVWGQHVVVSAPFVDEFVMEGGGSRDGSASCRTAAACCSAESADPAATCSCPIRRSRRPPSPGPRRCCRTWPARTSWASRSGSARGGRGSGSRPSSWPAPP